MIFKKIEHNKELECVIIYGKEIGEIFEEYLKSKYNNNIDFKPPVSIGKKQFKIGEFKTTEGKSFKFVLTPFFVNWKISYSDIESIVKELRMKDKVIKI